MFGKLLRLRRKELGMTAEEVAKAAHIGTSTVLEIEARGRLPRLDTADMIADALGMTINDLLNVKEGAV